MLWALPVSGVGVLLISGVLEHGAYGRDPRAGTLLGLGAGVAYVGFLLLLRRGGADLRRPAGPLFDATLVAAIVCIAAGLVIGDAHLVPTWPSAGWLALLALSSQVLGWLLITLVAAAAACGVDLGAADAAAARLGRTGALIFAESPSPLQLVRRGAGARRAPGCRPRRGALGPRQMLEPDANAGRGSSQ